MRWKKLPPGVKVEGQSLVEEVKRPRQRMNKTEAAYAQLLELQKGAGKIEWWAYEPIKLRLARTTFYTPDFMVHRHDSAGYTIGIDLIEVKGFWRDDARVKIKVAAEMFPMFDFIAVTKSKNGWKEEEF